MLYRFQLTKLKILLSRKNNKPLIKRKANALILCTYNRVSNKEVLYYSYECGEISHVILQEFKEMPKFYLFKNL